MSRERTGECRQLSGRLKPRSRRLIVCGETDLGFESRAVDRLITHNSLRQNDALKPMRSGPRGVSRWAIIVLRLELGCTAK